MTTCPVCGCPPERGCSSGWAPDALVCFKRGYEREKATADRRGKLLREALDLAITPGSPLAADIDAEIGPAAQKGSES